MNNTCYGLIVAICVCAAPVSAFAGDISTDATTILRFEKRDIPGTDKQSLLPATQFLGIDAEKLADGNLSAHFYGWGRYDLSVKSFNDEKAAGSLTYGYVQYRFNQGGADIRAGRFSVREGIVNEQVDGISARTGLPMGFGLSVFGGTNVHTVHISGENSDGKGDALFGGRVEYRYKGLLEIGLSGVYESAAPTLVSHTTGDYRRVGGDIWISPGKMVDIIGHSSYNTETDTFAEHSYLLTVKPVQHLVVTGTFNQQRDQSYLYAWTMFSAAALNPNDKSSSIGGSASYEINKNLNVTTDYKHYRRELGSADRFGGDVRVANNDFTVRGGIGYHYLDAGQGFAIGSNTSASYHELHCYALQDTRGYFSAIDLLGDFFKENIDNRNSAWEATATLGYHLTPALALSGDISYGRNPQFTEEVKGLVRLTYNTTFTGTGGKK